MMLADFYRIKWNLDEKRTSPFTGTESPHVCMSLFPVGVRTGKKKEHHVSQMEPTLSSQMLDSNFTLDICCYSLSFCLQYRCPKSRRTGWWCWWMGLWSFGTQRGFQSRNPYDKDGRGCGCGQGPGLWKPARRVWAPGSDQRLLELSDSTLSFHPLGSPRPVVVETCPEDVPAAPSNLFIQKRVPGRVLGTSSCTLIPNRHIPAFVSCPPNKHDFSLKAILSSCSLPTPP